MRVVACIGTRKASPADQRLCHEVGKWLVESGFVVRSGNAIGSDYAFQSGGNVVDPSKVYVVLPWKSYNAENLVPGNKITTTIPDWWAEEAAAIHPAWDMCSKGVKALHSRNTGIILGNRNESLPEAEFVLYIRYPNHSSGTDQGIRLADKYGIPYKNISGFTLYGVQRLLSVAGLVVGGGE